MRPATGAARRTGISSPLIVLTLAAALGAVDPASAAAASCDAQGLGLGALQNDVFSIDAADHQLGSYVGFRVTNTGATAQEGLWQRLESFRGGDLAPSTGGAATPATPIGTLAGGDARPTYAYLTAAGATTMPQSYDVVLYKGRPGAGGVELCRTTQSVGRVRDTGGRIAGRLTSTALSAGAPSLGGTFQLTVDGASGPIGDHGLLRFSPAVAAAWPSRAFQLVGVSSRIPLAGLATGDVLWRDGMQGPDRAYQLTYTFRVVGPTAGPTPVAPGAVAESGATAGHAAAAATGAAPPIAPVAAGATLTVHAGGTPPYRSGASVPLTATVHNPGASAISVDQLILRLPGIWTALPGRLTVNGTPAADPFDAGTDGLHVVGPYAVPAHGTLAVTLHARAGAPSSDEALTAVGSLGAGEIDATADPGDHAPASVRLPVLGAPVAVPDRPAAFGGRSIDVPVLANDRDGNGAARLTIVTPPDHGTAAITGDHLSYRADPGFAGQDLVVYRLTTPAGASDAIVHLSVAPPPAPPRPSAVTSAGAPGAAQAAALPLPPGGSVRLLDAAGRAATRVAVDGEGAYALNPATGHVAFTPDDGLSGAATPLRFRATDRAGQHADGTYTPRVTALAPPAPAGQASSGVGTAVQSARFAIPPGGSLALLAGDDPIGGDALAGAALGAHGAGARTFAGRPGPPALTVPGEGTYTLDPATGAVSFAPRLGFVGHARGVTVRALDASGQHGDATYRPTVLAPLPPGPARVTSTGPAGLSQRVTLPVPRGGSARLLDAAGRPVAAAVVPGVGTFFHRGEAPGATFTPVLGGTGERASIVYEVTDAYGQRTRAHYVATVTRGLLP